MRKGALAAGSLTLAGAGSQPALAQTASSDAIEKTDTEITSFDGTSIKLSLYEPSSSGPHPAVFSMQGGVARRGAQADRAKALAESSYVVLTYDPRGISPSGGRWRAGGERDNKDISALLDFLAEHDSVQTDENGDPRVGMEGGSGGGWRAIRAASQDDRIDAITGIITPYDASTAVGVNNVLKWPWAYFIYSAINLPWVNPPDNLKESAQEAIDTKEPVDGLLAWLEERSVKNGVEQVNTPTLVINGWHDRAFVPRQSFDLYRELSNAEERRLIMIDFIAHDFGGSPAPSPTEALFFKNARTDWLAKHLKDESPSSGSPVTGPPIDFYDTRSDTFESYEDFPDGMASFALGEAKKDGATELKTEGDGNAHRTAFDFPIDTDLDLAGVGGLSLSVTPTGGDPHLFAALKDVPPEEDKEPVHIKDQIAAMEITDPETVEFDLNGVRRTVPGGHTLRLVLTLNDDALADLPNLPDDHPFAPAFTDGLYVDSQSPAGLVVHHSKGQDSTLEVTTK